MPLLQSWSWEENPGQSPGEPLRHLLVLLCKPPWQVWLQSDQLLHVAHVGSSGEEKLNSNRIHKLWHFLPPGQFPLLQFSNSVVRPGQVLPFWQVLIRDLLPVAHVALQIDHEDHAPQVAAVLRKEEKGKYIILLLVFCFPYGWHRFECYILCWQCWNPRNHCLLYKYGSWSVSLHYRFWNRWSIETIHSKCQQLRQEN